MSKQLLTEYFALCDGGLCQDFLTEGEKRNMANGSAFYMTGKLQEANAVNGNGRIYPKTVLEREMKNYQRLIRERRALGELDHPDSSVVELKNVSHLVTDVWWDGNHVMGKIEVLNTPSGKTLKALAESGVQIGISSRGTGSVMHRGGQVIVSDDYNLICFDIVSDPSAPGAFMRPANGGDIQRKQTSFVSMNEGKKYNIYKIYDSILRD